jgi:hypothetical protein
VSRCVWWYAIGTKKTMLAIAASDEVDIEEEDLPIEQFDIPEET